MNQNLVPLSLEFALNTWLYLNCLVDVDDAKANARPSGQTNSMSFIAAHLADSRCWMARFIGLDQPKPFDGVLDYGTTIDQLPRIPTLAESREVWDEVSEQLEARLVWLSDEQLAVPSTAKFPGVPETVLGGVTFLVHHESYHIGQMALIRKYLGFPAMSYKRNP